MIILAVLAFGLKDSVLDALRDKTLAQVEDRSKILFVVDHNKLRYFHRNGLKVASVVNVRRMENLKPHMDWRSYQSTQLFEIGYYYMPASILNFGSSVPNSVTEALTAGREQAMRSVA